MGMLQYCFFIHATYYMAMNHETGRTPFPWSIQVCGFLLLFLQQMLMSFFFDPESTLLRDIDSNDVEIAVHVKDIQAFEIPTFWKAPLFRSGESKPRITGIGY